MTARRTLTLVAFGALVLAGCSGPVPKPAPDASDQYGSHHATTAPSGEPLRNGERFLDLTMPKPYTPKAPTTGTDDYRCFLLDPKLADPAFVTGIDVVPGRPDVVHHVILFRVGPDEIAEAKAQDADVEGQGWTCFGGAGLSSETADNPLESAPWLGAWARSRVDCSRPLSSGRRHRSTSSPDPRRPRPGPSLRPLRRGRPGTGLRGAQDGDGRAPRRCR